MSDHGSSTIDADLVVERAREMTEAIHDHLRENDLEMERGAAGRENAILAFEAVLGDVGLDHDNLTSAAQLSRGALEGMPGLFEFPALPILLAIGVRVERERWQAAEVVRDEIAGLLTTPDSEGERQNL